MKKSLPFWFKLILIWYTIIILIIVFSISKAGPRYPKNGQEKIDYYHNAIEQGYQVYDPDGKIYTEEIPDQIVKRVDGFAINKRKKEIYLIKYK